MSDEFVDMPVDEWAQELEMSCKKVVLAAEQLFDHRLVIFDTKRRTRGCNCDDRPPLYKKNPELNTVLFTTARANTFGVQGGFTIEKRTRIAICMRLLL